jgi:hypothetical protein
MKQIMKRHSKKCQKYNNKQFQSRYTNKKIDKQNKYRLIEFFDNKLDKVDLITGQKTGCFQSYYKKTKSLILYIKAQKLKQQK